MQYAIWMYRVLEASFFPDPSLLGLPCVVPPLDMSTYPPLPFMDIVSLRGLFEWSCMRAASIESVASTSSLGSSLHLERELELSPLLEPRSQVKPRSELFDVRLLKDWDVSASSRDVVSRPFPESCPPAPPSQYQHCGSTF